LLELQLAKVGLRHRNRTRKDIAHGLHDAQNAGFNKKLGLIEFRTLDWKRYRSRELRLMSGFTQCPKWVTTP